MKRIIKLIISILCMTILAINTKASNYPFETLPMSDSEYQSILENADYSINDKEPEHPFYVPNNGWTDAIKLRAGDILVRQNGDYVIVEKVQHEILEQSIAVYNFEVEDFHTYYVGDSSVLVHNANCGRITTSQATLNAEKIGFQKTNYHSHGQPVYYNSKKGLYITPDATGHNGGVWKMAKSLEDLGSKNTRMGTYDANLVRIGD